MQDPPLLSLARKSSASAEQAACPFGGMNEWSWMPAALPGGEGGLCQVLEGAQPQAQAPGSHWGSTQALPPWALGHSELHVGPT